MNYSLKARIKTLSPIMQAYTRYCFEYVFDNHHHMVRYDPKGVVLKGYSSSDGSAVNYGICYRSCQGNKHKVEVYRMPNVGPTLRKINLIETDSLHLLADECMHELRTIMSDDSVITCVGVMGMNGLDVAFDTHSIKTDLPVKWKVEEDSYLDVMPLPLMKQPRHMQAC